MDRIFLSMLRGFGWTIGRRVAYRLPLWPAVVLIIVLYLMVHL